MRYILLTILIGFAMSVAAVDLRLHGEVTTFGSREVLGDVLVRVYRNGLKEQAFMTGAGGRYSVDLREGGHYIIRFSRPGHVTKCFAVDTHGAAWEGDARSVNVAVEMTLFEKVDGLDLSFFDLPMGLANFSPTTGYLSWDKEYEERIRPEVDRLMAEVATHRLRNAPTVSHIGPSNEERQ
ncbi:MAG: hypothetical protein KDC00_03005 [Flavobacteriales bacterium]|nr:hypothetical protein [Flavobacteriales bacterium]